MTKRLLPFVFALALGATACGPNTYRVAGANQFAATDATITVDEDRGNYVTEIELRFLPPPSRVAEGTTTYVVWFIVGEQPPRRVGTVQYDEDDREGEAVATSPDADFTVLITAEADGTATSPSQHHVLERAVSGR